MPKRPTEATHTLSFTVIRTSNEITAEDFWRIHVSCANSCWRHVIQTQMEMCEIENKSFEDNKRLFLVHISPWEVMKTSWDAVRKLFYIHDVMYFWLKRIVPWEVLSVHLIGLWKVKIWGFGVVITFWCIINFFGITCTNESCIIKSRTFLDEKILYRTLKGSVLSGTVLNL